MECFASSLRMMKDRIQNKAIEKVQLSLWYEMLLELEEQKVTQSARIDIVNP